MRHSLAALSIAGGYPKLQNRDSRKPKSANWSFLRRGLALTKVFVKLELFERNVRSSAMRPHGYFSLTPRLTACSPTCSFSIPSWFPKLVRVPRRHRLQAELESPGLLSRDLPQTFVRWGGPRGYLRLIRDNCGFKAANGDTAQTIFPDEVRSAGLYEGAVDRVTVNAYERSPEARRRCIEHYGPLCHVCGMDFGAVHGPHAEGFIHVHPLKPLSEIGELYVTDPIADLRPVFPNCHAVIHLGGAPCSVEEARSLVDPRVRSFWSWLAEKDAAERENASGSD